MDTVSISTLPNPATGIPLTTNISGLLTKGGVNLLNLVFILAGLFFFVNLILAGWDFMLSSGDAKKVAAASVRITNGFIGIIMTLTAFVVVRIITTMLGLGTIV
ncbi:MAG: hypothetical protein UX08_C0003G0014 [Candidatus Collierbacteria bacterium GW2011_GWB1_45_35]|uniref:Integral membrane protein n=1 Tax=Candidatus Collierbacteria bacterium GW2011_GWB2_45_17 TaxID=1618388 RepID=A0A837IQ85_9BACT|nr:MAG: hypothetical protein UW48_C0006G0105 [Microgenomates group bacterium GW2011_GWC1_44_23]KKT96078.1 MAG: hypothetical protein UW96_C0002G0105 [Candidatus Collierbacteria bacterium GW2011_GWA1_45_15]KKU01048.1 MAG: hypothetical protein UX01_C0002G0014 [Candidatus Collierbacteria bacterium GW2011_GWB2_45_17]KKU05658.1 MAG: hypothetical protein UX08_C0003G0014 [Candidatus Collierbacteria bacterium GW2011_GWB1_45_35]KKU07941.1 MAG: hypothetical protein UX11_C0008G0014 [Candidatus Collierbacte